MADDVDAGNPRKKIKLDEESKPDGESVIADANMTSSTSRLQHSSGAEEQIKPGPSDTAAENKPVEEDIGDGSDSDSDSSVSALSDLSGLSGEDSWKGQGSGPMSWVYRNMQAGVSPRDILEQIIPEQGMIPNVDDFTLWKLVINIVTEPPARDKLPDINTIDDVIGLLQKCSKIVVLTGAGVSVSCGIPDFRSRNGVYARLAVDFPDLPDPQAMFDIRYFRNDQRPFFKFAKEIFPGQFEPSKCHKFIKLIESQGKLLRNYTQNIDTLEQVAGIHNIIQCHGSFATATCMTCSYKCPGDDIKSQINDQIIPMCPKCEPQTRLSVMKPDIVFFGESLPDEFHNQMSLDKDQCDLLIVIGSSLKVRPVALIPNSLPPKVPQILINKEALRNLNFDVELLGDCDTIIGELCRRLGDGWDSLANRDKPLTQISLDELLTPPATPTDLGDREPELGDREPDQGDRERDQGDRESDQTRTCDAGNPGSSCDTEKQAPCKTDKMATSDSLAAKQCDRDDKVTTSLDAGVVATDSAKSSAPETAESEKTLKAVQAETVVDEKKVDNASSGEKVERQCGATSTNNSGTTDTVTKESVQDSDQKDGSSNSGDKDEVEAGTADETEGATKAAETNLKSMWKPKVTKLSVAQRLGPNQYCLIPPHRYVFNDAEVFTVVGSESDSDDYLDDIDDDDDDLDLDENGLGMITKDSIENSPVSKDSENASDHEDVSDEKFTGDKERLDHPTDHISKSNCSEKIKSSDNGSGDDKTNIAGRKEVDIEKQDAKPEASHKREDKTKGSEKGELDITETTSGGSAIPSGDG